MPVTRSKRSVEDSSIPSKKTKRSPLAKKSPPTKKKTSLPKKSSSTKKKTPPMSNVEPEPEPEPELLPAPVIEVVYHEGGDSYRPFIILPVPTTEKWISPNIIYYRSSGRSNRGDGEDIKNKYRNGTFFPTIGLLDDTSPVTHETSEGPGHICKLNFVSTNNYFKPAKNSNITNGAVLNSVTGHDPENKSAQGADLNLQGFKTYCESVSVPPWWICMYNVLQNAENEIYNLYLKSEYERIDNDPKNANRSFMMKNKICVPIREKLINIIAVLSDYCYKWWQVQQSAQVGGGMWDLEPIFREYVLNTTISDEYYRSKIPPLTVRDVPLKKYSPIDFSMVPTEFVEGNDNYKEVIQVTKERHAVNERLLYGEITIQFMVEMYEIMYLGRKCIPPRGYVP